MKKIKQAMRSALLCVLRYLLRLWACITPGMSPEHGFVAFLGGSSSQDQQTNNTDNRNAVNGGGAVSGTGNTLTMTDNGAVNSALNSINIANANAGQNFNNLLSTTLDIFKVANSTTQASSSAVASGLAGAYSTAQADKAGSLDNRTIIMLAGIGAAVVGFIFWSKKK